MTDSPDDRELLDELAPFLEGLRAQYPFDLEVDAVEEAFFDPVQLERVVSNLLKNAREAQPQDTPELKVSAEAGWLRISVCDQGPGMSEEVLRQACFAEVELVLQTLVARKISDEARDVRLISGPRPTNRLRGSHKLG